MTIILVMTTIPLADAKARLSAVLDEVRDTHERVVITRNGHPEAVIMSVSDLEALEETLDLLSTPGALAEIRAAEAEIARGEATNAEELRQLMEQRAHNEQAGT
jgi:prevent-host-death family protein